jgi:hypothetical protein
VSRTARMRTNTRAPLRPLARVEAEKLIRHPAFLVGVGFVLVGIAMFVRAILSSSGSTWNEDGWTVGVAVAVLAILTMVAANLAALRDRRDDTVEQHMTLPVAQSTRTGAMIAATAGPAAVVVLLLAGVVGFAISRVPALTAAEQVHLAERLVAVVMLGTLGVALAGWLPSPFVAPVIGWGLLLVVPGDPPQTWQVLTSWASLRDAELATWHLGYLVGLTVLFGVAALARSSRSRSLVVAGVVGAAAVIGCAAVLLTRACPSRSSVCWF